MFARVTMVQLQPGGADDVTQYITELVVPAAQQAHGFDGLEVFVCFLKGDYR